MLTRVDLRGRAGSLDDGLDTPGTDEQVAAEVRTIVAAVRSGGDQAVRELTARFDGCDIDDLRVPPADVRGALEAVAPELRAALEYAHDRITAYHESQLGDPPAGIDRDGVSVSEVTAPIRRVGLYVPAGLYVEDGRAPYPSTVLMTAVPARVAGVAELALCVAPDRAGRLAPAILAAAALAGVDEVYRVGGAQAIAALAYGTESIPAVDLIAGPGNAYVTAAKREVVGVVGIDGLNGPSEVVVVADGTVPPRFAAADLLAQAEHGPGGSAILVTWDVGTADQVDAALTELVEASPRRADVEAALARGGRIVLVDDAPAAMNMVDRIAPEHLELLVEDADALLTRTPVAGAVFCGPWAPAAVADYVAGANHVLPTGRTARFASGLRVDTFLRHVHVVRATEDGLARVAPHVVALARTEGLFAHADSVATRQPTRTWT